MHVNAWWLRARLSIRYFLCRVRRHPEDPRHKGFCRCGEFQPSQAGVPMQHIDDWENTLEGSR